MTEIVRHAHPHAPHSPTPSPLAAPRGPIRVERVLGSRLDPPFDAHLHRLAHAGTCEELVLATADLARHRLRAVGSLGTEVLVALPRDVLLYDGAVIACTDDHAVVVRVTEQRWLRLVPLSTAAALELGHLAGNLHWRVRFAGDELHVALEGPEAGYRARLVELLDRGRIRLADPS